VDRLRAKSNSKNWTKMNFCHNADPIHLTADDNSDITDWYDDNDGAGYLCTVQGSDDAVILGDFAYTGAFTDFQHLEQAIRNCKAFPGSLITKKKMTTAQLIFGCRVKKNQQLSKLIGHNIPTGYVDWTMKADMMVSIECHHPHAPALKQHLYHGFNKSFAPDRIGHYNIRFIPADNMMRAGSSGDVAKTDSLMKHAAVVKSLKNITSTDFKTLDMTVKNMHGKNVCLREWLLTLSWPLINAGDNPKTLFFSADLAIYGRNKGTGTYNITAYNDRHSLAAKVVDILVALFAYQHGREAAKHCFHALTLDIINEVTFNTDDDGNWDGTWTSEEDLLFQDLLAEDMGTDLQIEGIELLETNEDRDQRPLLTVDDASHRSYGTALGRPPAPSQHSGEAADAGLVAAENSSIEGSVSGGDAL
jgi:hypothetical protein